MVFAEAYSNAELNSHRVSLGGDIVSMLPWWHSEWRHVGQEAVITCGGGHMAHPDAEDYRAAIMSGR